MFKKQLGKGFNLNFWLFLILANIFFGGLIIGVGISWRTNALLNKKIAETKEAERPADIDIVILQESNCQDCSDLSPLIEAIKKENVKINSEETVEIASSAGLELVNKYKITKVPTLIISGEIEKEANLKAMWPQLGEVKDNTFILTQVGAPYVLTSSGDVVGRVELIMLTDNSCRECYNVTQHEAILQRLGLKSSKQIIDISSSRGKELVDKYNIKLLPTIILIGDVEVYSSIKSVWSKVGTVEDDGTYVFREGVKQTGTYKDLTTNEIVKSGNTNQGSSSLKQIKVTGSEFNFNPSSLTIKKGENIQLTFTNSGAIPHDFALDELGVKTKVLPAGQSETISFTASQSGTFSFYCSVAGHRSAGMEGQLTVQ